MVKWIALVERSPSSRARSHFTISPFASEVREPVHMSEHDVARLVAVKMLHGREERFKVKSIEGDVLVCLAGTCAAGAGAYRSRCRCWQCHRFNGIAMS